MDRKMSFRESVPRRAKEGVMETLRGIQGGKGNKRKQKQLLVPAKRQRRFSSTSMPINAPPTPPNTIFS